MPKLMLLFVLTLVLLPVATAAMDPVFKECLQRGYEATRDEGTLYCVFSDTSRCPLEAFNENGCGQEFFTQDYCIGEGNPVWEEDLCCSGTQAYIPPNHAGQKTCQDISFLKKVVDHFYFNPLLRYSVISVLSVSIGIAILWYKKR